MTKQIIQFKTILILSLIFTISLRLFGKCKPFSSWSKEVKSKCLQNKECTWTDARFGGYCHSKFDNSPGNYIYQPVATPNLKAVSIGSGERTLVFVPGWLSAATPSFVSFTKLLDTNGGEFKMFLLDPPGVGVNSKFRLSKKGFQFNLEAQALSVLQFLHERELEKVTLIGHSFGAIVVMLAKHIALKNGMNHLISGLILLDPTDAFSDKLEQIMNVGLQTACALTPGKENKEVDSTVVGKLIRSVIERFPLAVAEQAKHIKVNVVCGTVRKLNSIVSKKNLDGLTSQLNHCSKVYLTTKRISAGYHKTPKDLISKIPMGHKHFIQLSYSNKVLASDIREFLVSPTCVMQ